MQKVVSISLNGIAYQLEEPGFERLRSYLERAELRLNGSPDRAEVMADLEQAIGEKCARLLGPHKSVVNSAELDRILEEMGPVESAEEKAAEVPGGTPGLGISAASAGVAPRKRLYKIREGAVWAGVCNGLAAYLNIDVTWIRIAVALVTVFTSGLVLLAYIVMAFIVPTAETPEDRAAAFGMPFSAEEMITRAKKNFEKFDADYRWRREWRRQQRHMHRQWQQMNAQMQHSAAQAMPGLNHAGNAITAVFLPIAAIVGAAVFIVWLVASVSLITQHSVFGWALPWDVPVWAGLLALLLAYLVIATPLKMIRYGAHRAAGYHPGWAFTHTLMWTGFVVLFFWAAYQFVPGVQELVNQIVWAVNLTASTLAETIV